MTAAGPAFSLCRSLQSLRFRPSPPVTMQASTPQPTTQSTTTPTTTTQSTTTPTTTTQSTTTATTRTQSTTTAASTGTSATTNASGVNPNNAGDQYYWNDRVPGWGIAILVLTAVTVFLLLMGGFIGTICACCKGRSGNIQEPSNQRCGPSPYMMGQS
ncbi:uncharacterized protein PAF06_020150 [Gastrophryne carolinensis]